MDSRQEAAQMEAELQLLFGETSYRVERSPCRGKYRGHNDYTLVFGSGRRLYIGLDARNYLPGLREKLDQIRYFRAHQAENTEKVKALILSHDTLFCDAAVDILPYTGSQDLCVYAVVILTSKAGPKLVYRETGLHYYFVSGDSGWHSPDQCLGFFLQDISGKMAYCKGLPGDTSPIRLPKAHPQKKREVAR